MPKSMLFTRGQANWLKPSSAYYFGTSSVVNTKMTMLATRCGPAHQPRRLFLQNGPITATVSEKYLGISPKLGSDTDCEIHILSSDKADQWRAKLASSGDHQSILVVEAGAVDSNSTFRPMPIPMSVRHDTNGEYDCFALQLRGPPGAGPRWLVSQVNNECQSIASMSLGDKVLKVTTSAATGLDNLDLVLLYIRNEVSPKQHPSQAADLPVAPSSPVLGTKVPLPVPEIDTPGSIEKVPVSKIGKAFACVVLVVVLVVAYVLYPVYSKHLKTWYHTMKTRAKGTVDGAPTTLIAPVLPDASVGIGESTLEYDT